MTCSSSTLAAILLAASVSATAAQTLAGAGSAQTLTGAGSAQTLTGAGSAQTATGAAPAQPVATAAAQSTLPRVELGGGFTGAIPVATEGEGFHLAPMLNARVGVALNRRWALEGAFDLWPESDDVLIIYRAQARWLVRGAAAPGRFQPHVTFGSAGGIEHESRGSVQWRDSFGVVHDEPRVSRWSAIPPIFPTVGVGVQKTLGAHMALRIDVAAIIIPFDDGAAVLLMPSVSLSFPPGPRSSPSRSGSP